MEIEAKLLAKDQAVLDAIAARRRLGPYRLERRPRQRLDTLYLDTRSRDLERCRVAFRIRRTGGRVEATIKLPGTVRGVVHRRPEWTFPLARRPRFPYRPPPGEIRDRLAAASRGRPLLPFIETRIFRRVMLVHRPGAREPVAEIDLDRVQLRLPAMGGRLRSSRYFEVEIELRTGGRADLARIVGVLRPKYGLKPSRLSKLERALGWARLEIER